jgi:nicotinamidase-related amidase
MLEKLTLSAAAADGFDLGGREQVLLCGIEAHICVYQTVADLLDRNVDVHLVVDCVASRSALDRGTAISRIASMGASLTTVEMALFELLGRAGSEEFKAVQKLVR